MKNILAKIKNSYFKSLKGEEKLWKVFWLWGALIYLTAIPIGSSFLILQKSFYDFSFYYLPIVLLISFISITVGILGQIFAFLYPIIFITSLWKCSKNTQHNLCAKISKLYIPIYLLLHVFLFGLLSCWGGLGLISEGTKTIFKILNIN